jgi:hypothetical protein
MYLTQPLTLRLTRTARRLTRTTQRRHVDTAANPSTFHTLDSTHPMAVNSTHSVAMYLTQPLTRTTRRLTRTTRRLTRTALRLTRTTRRLTRTARRLTRTTQRRRVDAAANPGTLAGSRLHGPVPGYAGRFPGWRVDAVAKTQLSAIRWGDKICPAAADVSHLRPWRWQVLRDAEEEWIQCYIKSQLFLFYISLVLRDAEEEWI